MAFARGNHNGFTLIELVVTITVILVLLLIAVPSFEAVRQRSALRGAAEQTLSFWNQARFEAVKRNQLVKVGVLVGSDGQFCLGAATTEDPADTTVCDCRSDAPAANACDVGRFPTAASEWRGVTLAGATLGGGTELVRRPAVIEPMRTSVSEAVDAGTVSLAAPAGPASLELRLAVDRLGRGRLCEATESSDALPEYATRRCAE